MFGTLFIINNTIKSEKKKYYLKKYYKLNYYYFWVRIEVLIYVKWMNEGMGINKGGGIHKNMWNHVERAEYLFIAFVQRQQICCFLSTSYKKNYISNF